MTAMSASDGRRRHWLLGAVGLLVALLATLFVLPGQAMAHAELLTTNPTAGQILDAAPAVITLTFNEPVEISLGGVRLFDGRGNPVEIGAASHPSGKSQVVAVAPGKLTAGSYVVDWRVVSADSHPVQGAFSFQIGATSNLQSGIVTQIINSDHTGHVASVGLGITRGVIIGAIALVFGGLVALGWGIVEATGRVRAIIASSAIVGAVAGLLQLPLEVAYATNRGLSTIVEPSSWKAAFDSRVGVSWVIRAAIVGAIGAGLLITVVDRRRVWWRGVTIAGLLAVGVVSAYGGHGATGRWIPVGVAATAVHVAGMAVWLGGLLLLLIEFRSVTAPAARRFSAIALVMLALVISSGVVQSIRQLGSIHALTNTTYGTLLILKTIVVVVLLAVAFVSRRIIRCSDVDTPRLGRAITIETILAVTIVAFTSVLMAANPSQVAAATPFSVTLTDGDYLASITVEPGHTGPNEMHIYLSDAVSSLAQPDEVTVEISDPSRQVAAIQIPVTRSGAGHFTTSTATFPYATTWTLTITARYNQFDEVKFTAQVKIS
jgi:copper transport protein